MYLILANRIALDLVYFGEVKIYQVFTHCSSLNHLGGTTYSLLHDMSRSRAFDGPEEGEKFTAVPHQRAASPASTSPSPQFQFRHLGMQALGYQRRTV
jgi:hypothetical protein